MPDLQVLATLNFQLTTSKCMENTGKGVPSGAVLKTMNPKNPTIIIKTLKREN